MRGEKGDFSSSAGCQGSGTGLRCQISSEWGSDEALGGACVCWRLSPRVGRSARTVLFLSSCFSATADLSHRTWPPCAAILGPSGLLVVGVDGVLGGG